MYQKTEITEITTDIGYEFCRTLVSRPCMIVMQRVNLRTDEGPLKDYGMQSHLPCSGYVSPAVLFKSQMADHIVVFTLFFCLFRFNQKSLTCTYSNTQDKTWYWVDKPHKGM